GESRYIVSGIARFGRKVRPASPLWSSTRIWPGAVIASQLLSGVHGLGGDRIRLKGCGPASPFWSSCVTWPGRWRSHKQGGVPSIDGDRIPCALARDHLLSLTLGKKPFCCQRWNLAHLDCVSPCNCLRKTYRADRSRRSWRWAPAAPATSS